MLLTLTCTRGISCVAGYAYNYYDIIKILSYHDCFYNYIESQRVRESCTSEGIAFQCSDVPKDERIIESDPTQSGLHHKYKVKQANAEINFAHLCTQ